MYSRNLFVLDFARRFFVNCAQISEAYVDEIQVQLAENRPQRQVQERLPRVHIYIMEVDAMETKNIILELRTKKGLSQEVLAQKVMVTRQAVSRWENGETVPNTETLKLLSKEFDVSINTLLGAPRQLVCQCCGMPLEDGIISHNSDGTLNEEYCKWCYADGTYTYSNMDDLYRCLRKTYGK